MELSLSVNGRSVTRDVPPRTLLVHFLRDGLDLTGTHVGCETSLCGACTVLMDGRAVKSCTLLAAQASGAEVTTIEGLAADGAGGREVDPDALHPLQRAFWEEHGLQCGFCTPGMILAAHQLLEEDPDPDDAAVREGLEGNLCRCTGYHNIVEAVRSAAREMREGG
jgi:carbon-monoxide dehydrogenase small subunit